MGLAASFSSINNFHVKTPTNNEFNLPYIVCVHKVWRNFIPPSATEQKETKAGDPVRCEVKLPTVSLRSVHIHACQLT